MLKKNRLVFISFLKFVLLFFCFFPFIGFNIGTDTQPFALLAAFLLLLLNKNKIKIYGRSCLLILLFVLIPMSIVSILLIGPLAVFKRLFSYLSIIIIPLAVYNSFNKQSYYEHLIKAFIIVWFVVGLIQTFITPSFLTFMIPLYRTTTNRGVSGLASEPSFYGYMCLFFIIIAFRFKRHKALFVVLNIIQIVFFAQSTVSLIYLAIMVMAYVFYALTSLRPRHYLLVFILLVAGVIGITLITRVLKDSRISHLIIQALEDPSFLILKDESVSARIDALAFSFSSYGLLNPIGIETIMSGFGGVFYELGFLSIVLFVFVLRPVYKSYNSRAMRIIVTTTLAISMFSAINLSSPLLGYIVGMAMIYAKQREYHIVRSTIKEQVGQQVVLGV